MCSSDLASNATYVVQHNWFKGGLYGIQINEDTAGSSWLVDGNYATTMNRFVQTFASMRATATYSNNRIVDVVKGIRLAESYAGTVIAFNTIDAETGTNKSGTNGRAIECGSNATVLVGGVSTTYYYYCESLEVYGNYLKAASAEIGRAHV